MPSIEERVTLIEQTLRLHHRDRTTLRAIYDLAQDIQTRFDGVDRRFDNVDTRLETIEAALSQTATEGRTSRRPGRRDGYSLNPEAQVP